MNIIDLDNEKCELIDYNNNKYTYTFPLNKKGCC